MTEEIRGHFRDFFLILFRCFDFLAALASHMHKTKYRGARDLSAVKFSALCDPWRSENGRKAKIAKIEKMSIKIDKI